MEQVKQFISLFWASTFNKVWLALVGVCVALYYFGDKKGWFRSGWKKYLPWIMVAVVILSFVMKKFILQKTTPSTGKK